MKGTRFYRSSMMTMISYAEINRNWSKLPNELQKLMMYCAIDISNDDQEDKYIELSLDHINNDIQTYLIASE